MKKFFEFIGLISLMCFSFFYTDKTLSVVKEMDDIMIQIENYSKNNLSKPKDAVIKGDNIIPGISGKEIDVEKSYKKMKNVKVFDESLLVYKKIKPNTSLKNNMNKYIISGNKDKKNISLVFLVKEKDKINKIYSILNEHNIKGNYFIDGYWFEDNNQIIDKIVKEGNVIGNLGYNDSYQNNSYIWMNTILRTINRKGNLYCLKTNNIKDLNACALQKNYTISPIVISDNPYLNTLNNISNGNILAYEVTPNLNKELSLIINKIKQKGLNIVSLDELIEE